MIQTQAARILFAIGAAVAVFVAVSQWCRRRTRASNDRARYLWVRNVFRVLNLLGVASIVAGILAAGLEESFRRQAVREFLFSFGAMVMALSLWRFLTFTKTGRL